VSSYYAFVLSVTVAQNEEHLKMGKSKIGEKANKVLEIEYALVFKAIKNAIKPRKKDKIEALNKGSVP